ncbi:hypothetical protein GPAL_1626 [Glaciecola pallidula DSM 14239 = ACAM 615]|uniref:Response regulatory domain-containing protein n=1 Tax=Brumicola pallidula DSM 14239 = ACAM 615 TaxID=1121922 RepID=K6ZYW9_9ALTE|nr:hypothetical protein GPAL_1626 [Glaciecola pallidula DSM 14239 = ACAM 615]
MLKNTKLVLVVDDSKVQCDILSALLKKQGYEVLLAYNVVQAVEM